MAWSQFNGDANMSDAGFSFINRLADNTSITNIIDYLFPQLYNEKLIALEKELQQFKNDEWLEVRVVIKKQKRLPLVLPNNCKFIDMTDNLILSEDNAVLRIGCEKSNVVKWLYNLDATLLTDTKTLLDQLNYFESITCISMSYHDNAH